LVSTYLQIIVFAGIFIVLIGAALVGLWKHGGDTESDVLQPTSLSDDIRSSLLQAREAKLREEKRVKRARGSRRKASRAAADASTTDADN
jgi:hypothetical protein